MVICVRGCVAIYKYNVVVVVVVVVLGLLSTTVDYEMCVASAWLRPAPGQRGVCVIYACSIRRRRTAAGRTFIYVHPLYT